MVLGHLGTHPNPHANSLLPLVRCLAIQKKTETELKKMPDINWAIIAPLIVLQVILAIFALTNIVKQEETNGPKWMWVLIILFVNTIGPILYFIIGRKNA